MTSTSSTILDPVTGLPLDQYSGIIQQIPLGSQVFPFEDLNADGRMTRQPIYGDDILPTSALVVGQDTKGMARAGTMDTSRRLWTREAVFQNLGKAIPDGTTAPVDVNVVSGGGGGGGGAVAMQSILTTVTPFTSGPTYYIAGLPTLPTTFYGYSVSVGWQEKLNPVYANGSFLIRLANQTSGGTFTFCSGQIADWSTSSSDFGTATAGKSIPFNQSVMFPIPFDLSSLITPDPNNMRLYIDGTQNLIAIQVILFMA